MTHRSLAVREVWEALDAFSCRFRLGAGGFAVALSGGPDSTALADVFLRWHQRKYGSDVIRPKAVIVDHKLRPESTHEAESVATAARESGFEPVVIPLNLKESKSKRVSQEDARIGRYHALYQACTQRSIRSVLTGHTQDDQAETVLLRILRCSGIRGLAGIPPLSILSEDGGQLKFHPEFKWSQGLSAPVKDTDVFLFRPFLGVAKSETEQYCQQYNLKYVLDPSNANMAYTRPAIRQFLGECRKSSEGGGQPMHCLDSDIRALQMLFVDLRLSYEEQLRQLVGTVVLDGDFRDEEEAEQPSEGFGIKISASALRQVDALLAEEVLLHLVKRVSPSRRKEPPRLSSIQKLREMVLKGKSFVLSGVECRPVPKTKRQVYLMKAAP